MAEWRSTQFDAEWERILNTPELDDTVIEISNPAEVIYQTVFVQPSAVKDGLTKTGDDVRNVWRSNPFNSFLGNLELALDDQTLQIDIDSAMSLIPYNTTISPTENIKNAILIVREDLLVKDRLTRPMIGKNKKIIQPECKPISLTPWKQVARLYLLRSCIANMPQTQFTITPELTNYARFPHSDNEEDIFFRNNFVEFTHLALDNLEAFLPEIIDNIWGTVWEYEQLLKEASKNR